MEKQTNFDFSGALKLGALAGAILIFVSLQGMVVSFVGRDIIYKTLSLGQRSASFPLPRSRQATEAPSESEGRRHERS